MRMNLQQPLDLALSLDSGQAFRWREKNGWWWGTLGQVAIKMRVVRDDLEIFSSPVAEEQLRYMIRDYFSLDDDYSEILESFQEDQYLDSVAKQFSGLCILKQEFWECLVAFLCSAECSVVRIRRMTEDLSRVFGNRVSIEGHTLWTFPEAYILAQASETELRDLGLGFRAPNILQAAQHVASGVVNKAVLQQMSYTEALSELMKFRGVGPKIASCVLLFSIDKKEAFPVDRWVRRSLERVYGLPDQLSQPEIEDWAQNRFGPNAGYAQQLLFHAEWTGAKNKPAR